VSLIYSSPVAAALFWLTFLAFVVLDGPLVARGLSGRAVAGSVGQTPGIVHRPIGLIWLGVGEVVGLAAAAFDPLVLRWRWPLLMVGLAIACAGLALRFWAKRVLGRFFVAAVVVQDGHRVVDGGPYAVIRHPGYAGMIAALLGFGIATANPLSMVVLGGVPLWVAVRTIRVEEAALTGALGEAYVDYARGTDRLLPRVW
jgi:protein-S-isoprenylcysteine O-methyltransferase Ste14